jgi:hypothetical protein
MGVCVWLRITPRVGLQTVEVAFSGPKELLVGWDDTWKIDGSVLGSRTVGLSLIGSHSRSERARPQKMDPTASGDFPAAQLLCSLPQPPPGPVI